jgi:hypothetical protein
MKNKYILIIFLLIIFQNCNNTTEPLFEKISSHFLLPAKVGNYWEYNRYTPFIGSPDTALVYKNYNSFGVSFYSVAPSKKLKWEVVDSIDIKIGNTTYPSYVFDYYYPDQNVYGNFNKPYWFGEDGIYNMGIFEKGVDTVFSKGLYIPTTIPLNSPWNGTLVYKQEGKLLSKQVIDRKCLSKNETIETPSGRFDCYVIYTRIREADDYTLFIDTYEYFAPNIGLICKVGIDIVPYGEVLPEYPGWWKLRYINLLTNFSTL